MKLETDIMKATSERYVNFSAAARPVQHDTNRPAAPATHRATRPFIPGPIVRSPICRNRPEPRRRLSVLPAGAAAVLAVENAYNKVLLGLFAACGVVAGATCFWHLQALLTGWSGFVQGWARVLPG